MKKLIYILLAATLVFASSCTEERSQVLKVYNWSSYIDEDLIDEFEEWYQEQTGEKITVIYQTFDINETMLTKIEKGKEDYDVVCPSDYMIERMLAKGLLKKIEKHFPDSIDYISNYQSPFIDKCFATLEVGDKDPRDYAVGYMWGTTGILYNAKYVTDEEASTWDVICNPKFKNKIFVKDSPRDVYSQIIIRLYEKEIAEGTVSMDSLMYYTGDENLKAVSDYMQVCKQYIAGWEADFGKEQMIKEQGWVNLNWSGDAVWAIEEAREVGVDLRWALPREGYTVWFDGWVIPKYAKNVKAASYWIDFMCKPENVIRNVDETGYVSACGAIEVMEAFADGGDDEETDEEAEDCGEEEVEEDDQEIEIEEPEYPEIDLSYFFGEEATAVRMNPVLYPDKADIERSCMEHDWGENTNKLIEMWSAIKGNNVDHYTVIVIGGCAVTIVIVVILRLLNRRKKSKEAKKMKAHSNN